MNINEEDRKTLTPSGIALGELYDKLGIDPDKYLDETLYPSLSSIGHGQSFSIADIMTESDIVGLLVAGMILKKAVMIKQMFGQPVSDDSDLTDEQVDAITDTLHYSADRIQQFALMIAVSKGLSDFAGGDEEFYVDDVPGLDNMRTDAARDILRRLFND